MGPLRTISSTTISLISNIGFNVTRPPTSFLGITTSARCSSSSVQPTTSQWGCLFSKWLKNPPHPSSWQIIPFFGLNGRYFFFIVPPTFMWGSLKPSPLAQLLITFFRRLITAIPITMSRYSTSKGKIRKSFIFVFNNCQRFILVLYVVPYAKGLNLFSKTLTLQKHSKARYPNPFRAQVPNKRQLP